MILKMKLGAGFRGLDRYVTGKPGATILATNMAGTNPRERAAEVAGLRSAKPDLRKAIGHLVLSHDPSLPDLTPDQWRTAIDIARAEHDMRDAPFCAVLHRDSDHRHVHLFFYASARVITASLATRTHTGRTRPQRDTSKKCWVFQRRRQSPRNRRSVTVNELMARRVEDSANMQPKETKSWKPQS